MDHFAVAVKKGVKYAAATLTYEINSPTEVLIRVLDPKGAEVARSNPAQPVARVEFTPAADGDYVVACEHVNYLSGPNEIYHLSVQPVTADFNIVLALDRCEAPPDGGTAVLATVNRLFNQLSPLAQAALQNDRARLAQLFSAATLQLEPQLRTRIAERGLDPLYRNVELPLTRVLAAMEDVGVRIDTYRMGEITARLAERVEELEARAQELAGEEFMLGSTQQVARILFEVLGLTAGRKGKDRQIFDGDWRRIVEQSCHIVFGRQAGSLAPQHQRRPESAVSQRCL